MGQKILIIEDNSVFRKTVSRLLSENGYSVAEAATGKEGLSQAARQKPDLVILDLVLPGIGGMEVCGQFKLAAETAGMPILILTGNDRDGQEIACLDMGADDYLTKPVKTERLLAHCRALLRRTAPDPAYGDPTLRIGDLILDFARKLVILKGEEYAQLTPKEFGLIYELALRSPGPQDRSALYRRVWGMEPPSEGSLKTVDVHIRRIRLKLGWENDARLAYVNGRGYCLKA